MSVCPEYVHLKKLVLWHRAGWHRTPALQQPPPQTCTAETPPVLCTESSHCCLPEVAWQGRAAAAGGDRTDGHGWRHSA